MGSIRHNKGPETVRKLIRAMNVGMCYADALIPKEKETYGMSDLEVQGEL